MKATVGDSRDILNDCEILPMVRLQLYSQPQIFQTKLTVWLRRPKSFLYGIIQEWVSLAKLPKLGIDTKTSAQDLLLPLFTL